MNTYPAALNNYTGNETLFVAGHASEHNALEQKLGISASTPIASTVLRGTGTGTSAWGQIVLSTDITGILPVANGGTGVATLTSGEVLIGAGTSAITSLGTSGTGNIARVNTPSFTTPSLGAATATSINGLTITSSTGILTITNAKTLAVTNTLTLSGTDSTVMTFPSTTATIARTDAAQTFTGIQTIPQVVNAPATATVTTNATTITRANRINNVTNSSAATLTITLSTSGALDGDMLIIRVFDFSAVAQTITWVNTENSNTSVPTTSNGSTTLPLTIGLQYNNATSKWRCLASS